MRIIKFLGCFLMGCGLLGLVIYNWQNNSSFWEASAVNCITIGVGIFISYYLVQRSNDRRKQKDIIVEMALKLQEEVVSDSAYNFSKQTTNEILMRQRDFGNKISILKEYKKTFNISEDVDFIEKNYKEYAATIGNNISNLDYLRQLSNELRRPLFLMSDRLFRLTLHIYK